MVGNDGLKSHYLLLLLGCLAGVRHEFFSEDQRDRVKHPKTGHKE